MLSNEISQQEFEKLIAQAKEIVEQQKDKRFVILLAGRTGVGKSSTINSLMDKEVAPVGDYEPTTMTIEKYDNELNGVPFTIYDSPGLCDELEERKNDYTYINLMIEKIEKLDSMWFVTRLDDTRVSRDEKRGIKLISQAFGKEVWQQAIIVFTFAGNVKPEKYSTAVVERTRLIKKEIANYINADVAENIPSVAVDNHSKTTPDGKTWLNKLFTNAYKIMSDEGAFPLIFSLLDRLEPPKPKVVYETKIEKVYVDKPSNPSPQASTSNLSTSQNPDNESQILMDTDDEKIIIIKTLNVFSNFTQYHQTGKKLGEQIGSHPGRIVGGTAGGIAGGAADGAEIGGEIAGDLGKAIGRVVGGTIGGIVGFFKSF
ncbi:MAG: 50S ribosome-binding GTPase [Calothrix sp. MO_167.B12]|nr:50S ribosome-binding GTPase [Calothrix sp. MO_167.B12]